MSRTFLLSLLLSLIHVYITNGFHFHVQKQQQLHNYHELPSKLSIHRFHISPPSLTSHPHSSSKRTLTRTTLSSVTPNLNSSPSTEQQQNNNGNDNNHIHHHSKLRILKDRMWVRETLEDLTAAEFASSIAIATSTISTTGQSSSRIKKSKSAVDFDNILNNLNRRIEEMCVTTTVDEAQRLGVTCHILDRPAKELDTDSTSSLSSESSSSLDEYCFILRDNLGKGCVTYTREQRDALLVYVYRFISPHQSKSEHFIPCLPCFFTALTIILPIFILFVLSVLFFLLYLVVSFPLENVLYTPCVDN